MNQSYQIVTTIAPPTDCVRALVARGGAARTIIIGDKKGPDGYDLPGTEFYSLADQLVLPYTLARQLPTGHYARKNLGYLIAVERGASCIYETDDDNAPNEHWAPRARVTQAVVAEPNEWLNVYRHFSAENIWPRGFPLDRITDPWSVPVHDGCVREIAAPIQQGLADCAPDVDAIWRLTCDRPFEFERNHSIALPRGSWCPFNTQTAWWWEEAYPLLYLPSHCSFRMTDIWKSFIAQRCVWEMDGMVVFHSPEVIQDRNYHNLMRDFEAEIPGYTLNEVLARTLMETKLAAGRGNALDNLVRCYEALIGRQIFPAQEMDLVKNWVEDLGKLIA